MIRRSSRSLAKTGTAEPPLSSVVVPVYFDSALVGKFYLNEPGREAVRRLAAVTSGIAMAEVAAAFHRRFRAGAPSSAHWMRCTW